MADKTSIDLTELNKFNKTYFQWWDTEGEFKLLHQINPIRAEYIVSRIKEHFHIQEDSKKPLRNVKMLDVGCGGGLITTLMYNQGANITGLDANAHNIKAAKYYALQNKLDIDYICTAVEDHVKTEIKYDVILCLEVIEHIANIEEFILNLSMQLSCGGILIISTINRTLKSYVLAIAMAEYILRWVPVRTHDYNKFVRPSELVRPAQNAELNVKELKGLTFSLSDCRWGISDDIDVNYFAVFNKRKAI